jgi:tol-pal system protein YbgF
MNNKPMRILLGMLLVCMLAIGCLKTKREVAVEQDVEDLKSRGTQMQKRKADSSENIDDVKTDIQLLKGQVEEQKFMMSSNREASQKASQAMEERMAALEERMKKLEDLLEKEKAEETPNDVFSRGLLNFQKENYELARSTFKNFTQRFPKSELVAEAQFWVAESFFQEKKFYSAVTEYNRFVESYPQAKQVASATYKQGLSFIALGKTKEGKLFLNQVIKKYPDSDEATQAKNALAKLGKKKTDKEKKGT